MRLLLSSRDLTSIFERAQPVPPQQLATWIEEREGSLVLTGTNVVELSISMLEAGKQEVLRSILAAIAAVPQSYLKEMAIFVEELGGAMVAFGRGREPLKVDPYMAKWSDTLGISLGKHYSSQGIYETVTHLWRTAPEALRHFHRYQEILAEDLSSRPTALEGEADSPEYSLQRFASYIERQLKLHGFALPKAGPQAFAAWVQASPLRCPGIQLAFALREQITAAARDGLSEAPLRGLGHLHAIPYVERITIEPPLFGYCQTVCAAVQQATPAADLVHRIYPDLHSFLENSP